jgi:hypothetical protein
MRKIIGGNIATRKQTRLVSVCLGIVEETFVCLASERSLEKDSAANNLAGGLLIE